MLRCTWTTEATASLCSLRADGRVQSPPPLCKARAAAATRRPTPPRRTPARTRSRSRAPCRRCEMWTPVAFVLGFGGDWGLWRLTCWGWGVRQPRTTTEDMVEVSPAVLRRLATAEKLKVSAMRCVRSLFSMPGPPHLHTRRQSHSHPCGVYVFVCVCVRESEC